eukprot:7025605-Prymnesium_polylepis.1
MAEARPRRHRGVTHGGAYRALSRRLWRRNLPRSSSASTPPRRLSPVCVRARVQSVRAGQSVSVSILLACILLVSHPPTRGYVP